MDVLWECEVGKSYDLVERMEVGARKLDCFRLSI